MLCSKCGRRTNIKYSSIENNSTNRTRECSQGHVMQTVELEKRRYSSLNKVRKKLIDPEAKPIEQAMVISDLIGDLI